jgi:hypothetical protein
MAGEIFRSTFTANELIKATGSLAMTANEVLRLGEYKVQAGEEISVGSGQLTGMESATGRIFMDLRDTAAAGGAAVSGMVRLQAYSAQNRPIEIINEWRTEDLYTNATDKTKQLPCAEHSIWLREDQRLVLEFIPDTGGAGNGTLSKAQSKILMAMTKKAL